MNNHVSDPWDDPPWPLGALRLTTELAGQLLQVVFGKASEEASEMAPIFLPGKLPSHEIMRVFFVDGIIWMCYDVLI